MKLKKSFNCFIEHKKFHLKTPVVEVQTISMLQIQFGFRNALLKPKIHEQFCNDKIDNDAAINIAITTYPET